MSRALIVYYSRTGRTKEVALYIKDCLLQEKVDCAAKAVADVKAAELLDFDGIIIGSPTYYGAMCAEIKKLLDDSVKFHGKMDGKIGAAFTSSANIAGGNETTIWSILNAMLIHGMIIQGDPEGSHYGPVSVTGLDSRVKKECKRFASRFAALLKRED